MSMSEWAKKEVEIACKRERGDDENPDTRRRSLTGSMPSTRSRA